MVSRKKFADTKGVLIY